LAAGPKTRVGRPAYGTNSVLRQGGGASASCSGRFSAVKSRRRAVRSRRSRRSPRAWPEVDRRYVRHGLHPCLIRVPSVAHLSRPQVEREAKSPNGRLERQANSAASQRPKPIAYRLLPSNAQRLLPNAFASSTSAANCSGFPQIVRRRGAANRATKTLRRVFDAATRRSSTGPLSSRTVPPQHTRVWRLTADPDRLGRKMGSKNNSSWGGAIVAPTCPKGTPAVNRDLTKARTEQQFAGYFTAAAGWSGAFLEAWLGK